MPQTSTWTTRRYLCKAQYFLILHTHEYPCMYTRTHSHVCTYIKINDWITGKKENEILLHLAQGKHGDVHTLHTARHGTQPIPQYPVTWPQQTSSSLRLLRITLTESFCIFQISVRTDRGKCELPAGGDQTQTQDWRHLRIRFGWIGWPAGRPRCLPLRRHP